MDLAGEMPRLFGQWRVAWEIGLHYGHMNNAPTVHGDVSR